ncbi:MAG: recombination mediator RecR [Dehalococcoidia bacterium]|tara:strand:- start:739 stop:1362 length:624 start_codon:yes stop_codon:yes gene_type:complete
MTLNRSSLPVEIQKLIIAFSSLPGIGPKTAQRLTFYVLSQNIDETMKLSEALRDVKKALSYCQTCFFITNEESGTSCNFCIDKDSSSICVVENIVDAITIEMSGIHSGSFHILHGSISPMNGIGPENLKVDELMKRISLKSTNEIILATNPTLEGEATSMYLSNFIKDNFNNIKVTKLAKGLASGTDLEYSDFNTLSNAFENRTNIN